MATNGQLMPTDTARKYVDPMSSSVDSFKQDLQAIGRAVERLREGFAGTAGSISKSIPGHDSSNRRRALSSLSLGSPTSSCLHGGPDSEPRSPEEVKSNALRDWSAGGHGDDSLNDAPLSEHSRASAVTPSEPQSDTGALDSSADGALAGEVGVENGRALRVGDGSETLDTHLVEIADVGTMSYWHQGELDTVGDILWPSRPSSDGDEARKRPGPSGRDDAGWDGRMSARKRRSKHYERAEDVRGRGEEAEPRENSNLLDLRHALRASGEDLMRLKRDVAVGVPSSDGSKRRVSPFTLEGKGSGDEDSIESRPSDTGSEDRLTRYTSPERDPAPTVKDGGSGEHESARNDDIQSPSMLLMEKIESIHPAECLLGDPLAISTKASDNTGSFEQNPSLSDEEEPPASFPSRIKALPQPPLRRVPKSPAKPLPPSGGAPALGSPLVASAFEGLKKMRSVLLDREHEADRARQHAEKTAERLSKMSSELQRRESECKAQESQMAETQGELEAARAEIAKLKRTKDALQAAGTRGRAERLELDEQVMLLRESLDVTTKTLEEEKSAKKKFRTRLGALEEEVARAAERARLAEGNAKAKSAAMADAKAALTRQANTAKELQTLQRLLDETSSDVERLRSEADGARAETESARQKLVAVENASRAQAREASHARERLKTEKDKSARVSEELETAIRQRNGAVEKLSKAEADAGRLRVELTKALAVAEAKEAADHEREEAARKLTMAESEVEELRSSLAATRERLKSESRRFEREVEQARGLRKELDESEVRRRGQDGELSRVRDQVTELAAQIESDRNRAMNEARAAAEVDITAAARREERLRARLEESEAGLRAAQDRERESASAVSKLEAEVVFGRDAGEQAEVALAEALTRIRIAETSARSHAQAAESMEKKAAEAAKFAMHDKETMRRGLADTRAEVAEVRAENSRLVGELARASAASKGKGALALGSRSDSSPRDEDTCCSGAVFDDAATAVAAAAEAAVVQAAEAAAKSAASNALQMREKLESRLALSQAEAIEARTEVQRLKLQVKAISSSEWKITPSRPPIQEDCGRRQEQMLPKDVDRGRDDVEDRNIRMTLREACDVMETVSDALSEAVEGVLPLPDGRNDLGSPWGRLERGRPEQTRGHGAGRGGRGRRALSVDRYAEDVASIESRDEELHAHLVIRAEVREISERLRLTAATLLSVRREEREAAKKHLAKLQEELRRAEMQERSTAARLEESRELTREQTGFVEGVWKERRHLEAELSARVDEVRRLRVSEEAARAAAAGLEERVEALSSALKMGQAQARSEAEAEATVEAGEAMDALRRQLDELRREVNKTKRHPGREDENSKGTGEDGEVSGKVDAERSTAKEDDGATTSKLAGVRGKAFDGGANGNSLVFEAEFQRLRAKYEKAKGRIAGLEEQAAATRRATMLARKEFQGAVDTLKMSQELLLRVCGKEQGRESCSEAGSPSSGENRPSESTHGKTDGRSPTSISGPAGSPNAPVHELDAQVTRLRDMTQSVRGLLRSLPERDQREVEDPGSRRAPGRGRKREVHRVLPVDGVVGDGMGGERASAVTAAKQAEGDARESKHLDAAPGELRIAEAKVESLQAEEARLNAEIERASAELSRVQELLNTKTKQADSPDATGMDGPDPSESAEATSIHILNYEVKSTRDIHKLVTTLCNLVTAIPALDLEARVTRAERERREARDAQRSSEARAKESQAARDTACASLSAVEEELSDVRRRLEAVVKTEAELRKRCEELSHASGTFAAEASRQKDERAKWREHSRLAAANAAELRKRCAELVRKSEESTAERARLERELSTARSESQEIDADVAQVLDALSVSEKERKRLEGELARQSQATNETRRAPGVARGSSSETKPEAKCGWAQCTKDLGGSGEAGAPNLNGALQPDTNRRAELEKDRKALASRVADLEAALVSASGEVRKAAKLGAERGAQHDRETGALKEEITRLRSALRLETTKVQETLKRLVSERAKWNGDKLAIQRDTIAQIKEAIAQANAKTSARRGLSRERLAELRERQEYEIALLRKETEELTRALEAETARASEAFAREASIKATATREMAELQDKLSDVESALNSARFRDQGTKIISHDVACPAEDSHWLQTGARPVQVESASGVIGSTRKGANEERRARHHRWPSPGKKPGSYTLSTMGSHEDGKVATCNERADSRVSKSVQGNHSRCRTSPGAREGRDSGRRLSDDQGNAGEGNVDVSKPGKSGAGSAASSKGRKARDADPSGGMHSPSGSSLSVPRGTVSSVSITRSDRCAVDRVLASSPRVPATATSNTERSTVAHGHDGFCGRSSASSPSRTSTRYPEGRERGRHQLDAGVTERRGSSRSRREARETYTTSDRVFSLGTVPSSPRSSASQSAAAELLYKRSMVSRSGTPKWIVPIASVASNPASSPGNGIVDAREGGADPVHGSQTGFAHGERGKGGRSKSSGREDIGLSLEGPDGRSRSAVRRHGNAVYSDLILRLGLN